ncbi:hypothetical protein EJF36_12655 [Bacillus sp. HMF5848]|uniref:hypothetical protein n=1 Tax=Bacillus sp. HMF5848 TaxID=2495421 RepID=UPI000F7873CC|nr:hypothetical protein [Bacillus sp. HMF5848]RSK27658.1 hypothetical protein EJF36_12655 [Bacillus sp. HMF5848]
MPYEIFDLRFFIDTAVLIVDGIRGIGGKEKAKKLMEDLDMFIGKHVFLRTGKVSHGGSFKVKKTYELQSCKIERDGETIYLYVEGADIQREFIVGKTISKHYTGRQGDNRVLINTSGLDFLLELTPSVK